MILPDHTHAINCSVESVLIDYLKENRSPNTIKPGKNKTIFNLFKYKENAQALLDENTPPSSTSFSRVSVGKAVAARNRRRLKAENIYLKNRIKGLETSLAKNRMRYVRLTNKMQKFVKSPIKKIKTKSNVETKRAVQEFLLQDRIAGLPQKF